MSILRFEMQQRLKPYAIQFIDIYGDMLRNTRNSLGFFNFSDKKNLDMKMEQLLYARTNIYVAVQDNGDILLPTENANIFQNALLTILELNKLETFNLMEDEMLALVELSALEPSI